MPRESEEVIVAKMAIDEQDRAARYAAATLGPAPDLDTVSGQREQEMWEFKDPGVDPMALFTELSAQGMDKDTLETEFTKRLYPYREVMLQAAGNEDEPDKRIAYAKTMKRQATEVALFGNEERKTQMMPVLGGTANALPQPAAKPPTMEGY